MKPTTTIFKKFRRQYGNELAKQFLDLNRDDVAVRRKGRKIDREAIFSRAGRVFVRVGRRTVLVPKGELECFV